MGEEEKTIETGKQVASEVPLGLGLTFAPHDGSPCGLRTRGDGPRSRLGLDGGTEVSDRRRTVKIKAGRINRATR